jgi:hypothetical protein
MSEKMLSPTAYSGATTLPRPCRFKALNRRNPGIKVISIKTMMPLSAGIG